MRNKYLLVLLTLVGYLGFSQSYVKVDDTYTPDQLIKDVLVRSGCDLVSNVRYQYGSGAPGSDAVKAIGYFNRNGSAFPFDDGVVLATDISKGVEGPCTVGNGPTSPNQYRWLGDQDLLDLINDAGGWPTTPVRPANMRSTVIDFEFIPVQSTVSFEYLFGSHSYNTGCNFECGNGAMFGAWLIDTTTAIGENLAKIPGTNDPISINTLRDVNKSYPNTCPAGSINPQYFGNSYGTRVNQLPPASAPINLSGHTIAMKSLTANVVVGRKYKIKLAVIDFCPTSSHTSAVFFKAGSFDIGKPELGDPVLIEEGNGLCVGDTYTLESGMDPKMFTFEWYKDGVLIPGQTGANLVVTETGKYNVKVYIPNVSACTMESEPVLIEFYEYTTLDRAPVDVEECPTRGTTTRFDLREATDNSSMNPDMLYSYHLTQQDAKDGKNALPVLYDVANTSGPVTIWVRAYFLNNPCVYTTSFRLIFANCNLYLNQLPNLSICEGDIVQTFDLSVQTPVVYNNAVGYTVTYHLSESEAINNLNAIPQGNLANYNGVHNQRIWVRVTKDTDSSYYGVTSFFLFKYRLPLTNNTVLPLTTCEKGITGIGDFDLNIAYNLILQMPTGAALEFYEFQQDAILGNTALMLPVKYTSQPKTIYVRVRSLDNDCFKVVPLELRLINTPIANQIAPVTYCDFNNDGFGEFNLDPLKVLIAGNPLPQNGIVTFHETQADADSNVNVIQNVGNYVNRVANQQTIYARVGYTNSSCYATVPVVLKVNKVPAVTPIGKLQICDINNDNIEVFDLTKGEKDILAGLNANEYDVTYHITHNNAIDGTGIIGNPSSFSSNTAKTVFVRITDKLTKCYVVIKLDLELIKMPKVSNPLPTYFMCDTDGNGFEIFDLASKIPSIVGTQQGLDVTFYYTNNDAQTATSPLPLMYQNGSANVQTIFVRVSNGSSGCFVVTTMKLQVQANPVINVPTKPYVICNSSTSGFGTINLFEYGKALVDASGMNYAFKFFETKVDAERNVNDIQKPDAYNNLKPSNPTVWIRVEDVASGCFSVYPMHFQLVLPPNLPKDLPEIVECDVVGDRQDSVTLFDLTKQNASLLAAQTVTGTYQIRYFTSQALAESNTNWIPDPTKFLNTTNPQTIWVRIEDTSLPGSCNRIMSFTLKVNAPSVLKQPLPIVYCDTTLPNDGKMEFDLTIREADVLGGQPFNTVVTYHLTKQHAELGSEPIYDPKKFYNTVNPQTIYISVLNQFGCRSVTTLTVRVLPVPEPNMKPLPLEKCETVFGGREASFNLHDAEADLSNYSDYEYAYFVSQIGALTNDDNDRIGTPEDWLTGSSYVYVRVTNKFTDTDMQCVVVVPLQLIVNPIPNVGPMTPLVLCMENPTLHSKFNLRDKDKEALAGANPDDYIVRYFASEESANKDENPLPFIFTNTEETRQIIWVRVENKKTGCFNVTSFLIQIERAVHAYTPKNNEFCENDYENDGVTMVDLTIMDTEVIGGQPQAANLLVRYYRQNGTPIADPTNVQIRNGEVLRAEVFNQNADLYCTSTIEITIKLKDAPIVLPLKDGVVCYEYRDKDQIISGHYLNTGLTSSGYTFEWFKDGAPITNDNADVLNGGTRIFVKQAGAYSVTVTGVNGCITTRSAVVTQLASITIDEVKLTDSFGDTNGVEVIAYAGTGATLEYRLDEGAWQESNIFLNVTPGEHTVYVRIKGVLSCEVSKVITVMDFPKFFTPNNDGYNDTWNIWSLKNQPKAKIYIFDRFGKLLKELSPAGAGWDGTFNGQPLPSTDYWFKAEYIDPKTGLQKEATGHFSLKR